MSPAASSADGEEADAVEPLPVSALGADEAITRGLRRAGLKTIGDVASRARHEITARFGAGFTTLLEAGAGAGRCADQPAKAAAGLHRGETVCRTGRHRSRDLGDLVPAGRDAGRGDGPAGQGRAAAGSQFLPHRRRGAHDCRRHRATRDQGRGDRPAVSRAARCLERSARSRFRLRSHSPVRQPRRNRGAAAARSRCQCARQ